LSEEKKEDETKQPEEAKRKLIQEQKQPILTPKTIQQLNIQMQTEIPEKPTDKPEKPPDKPKKDDNK